MDEPGMLGVNTEVGVGMKRFNVIELILVLTILVGFGAVLLPLVYNSAKKAQTVSCVSNLGTLGGWVTAYANDSDGVLPAYENGWVAALSKASRQNVDQKKPPAGLLACPSQKHVSYGSGSSPADWWRGTNYGINQHMASNLKRPDGELTPYWAQANIRNLHRDSEKVLMADATGGNVLGIKDRDPVIAGISPGGRTFVESLPPSPTIGFPYLRHLGGTGNFLYVDMHVDTRNAWPEFAIGRGTRGFYFWHAGHIYPELSVVEKKKSDKQPAVTPGK